MTMAENNAEFIPAFPFVKVEEGGAHWLAGSKCAKCGATIPGERVACPSCGARGTLEPVRLGSRGTLYNFTVVHRSYPGVKTPFVSAVVDLEGGGTLKGTLLDVDPDPTKLPADLPVDLVFRDTGQKNPDGKPFLCYYFTPSQGAAS